MAGMAHGRGPAWRGSVWRVWGEGYVAVKYDMTIAARWRSYEKWLPADTPLVQTQETKRAFYAGVAAALGILARGGFLHAHLDADDAISEEAGDLVLKSCQDELSLFVREVVYRESVRMEQWRRHYE